jgi:beta-N-acetylhexosaminidase
MKKYIVACLLVLSAISGLAQYKSNLSQQEWADSVFKSLSYDERIAQLIVVRAHSNLGPDHVAKVTEDIQKYNVGALCFFQGGPVRQANLTNFYQSIAKTPLMVTIDGEWGLGMRLDSVTKFPYQLTLGALGNADVIYRMGLAVGEQCKRLGVHVNYAPVVDVNNNPNNPVIGYRSFGEDVSKVTDYGVAYMRGMQDAGIMACAKHFPGHGDVDVDSHFDLPVVNKTVAQLNETELVPFRALFNAGVGSVMIAHLFIPSIDNTANKATSISKKNVTGLLRKQLDYNGLTFTDALEMKGVAKYFPGGKISVEALIAGNDMLCLPASVPETIAAVRKAIKKRKLSWSVINAKVKKVLMAKYKLGLNENKPIALENLLEELNAKTNEIRHEVAMNSITVMKSANLFPDLGQKQRIAYVGFGSGAMNEFGKRLQDDAGADVYLFPYAGNDSIASAARLDSIRNGQYDAIVTGIHDYTLRPANNYGISAKAIETWRSLQSVSPKVYTFVFGNVLASVNFSDAANLVACYQDDDITRNVGAELFESRIPAKGTLPVTVAGFKYGEGIAYFPPPIVPKAIPAVILDTIPKSPIAPKYLLAIDSIVNDAIRRQAFPGCVVLAAHKGELIYYKPFGHYEYGPSPAVTRQSIFDLASVTKISATTIAVMKLYEEGKLDLKKTLGDYLPWVKGSNKENLVLEDVLLHEAGLVPYIAFYRETIDAAGMPNPEIYSTTDKPGFNVRVARELYLRNDWQDTMLKRILTSPLGPAHKYVYSDNDFIFLGKIVEAVSGMPLNDYVEKNFYEKMGMTTTGFKPLNRFSVSQIVPTEKEAHFRRQTLNGDVHDEGASLFGGVAGHAGLFSDAYDLAMLYQMLLNGGVWNGQRYLKEETIKFFTSYHSDISRRGFGFDKPEKDNATRKEPYPSSLASPETFGHTGFTGTCVWVDPKYDLVYIFLSNRVYPSRDNSLFGQLNIRSKIQDAIYRSLGIK